MFAAPEYLLGIPITGLIFGVVAYFWLGREARKFDRKYGRGPGE
jgi:hypothetical protein